MADANSPVLVFGATGQQGGSVADALLKAGKPVRALVRDPASDKAAALGARGVELIQGDMADPATIRRAMAGALGVFSVQTSSPGGEISDADEVRYGISIADLAVQAGVRHLVYTSVCSISGAEVEPTGMGHFDSKREIEAHVRALPLTWTIVRPVTFMEMLTMPGFGLGEGRFTFFMRPDQAMQFLAVEDVGKFVVPILADPGRFGGQTIELASDTVTGAQIGEAFSRTAGRPIGYSRFPDDLLAANPFLGGLTALLDAGPLAGNADLDALRAINPEMQPFETWLGGSGREAFGRAMDASGAWEYDPSA